MGGVVDKEEAKVEEEYVINESISPEENLRALGYIIHKESDTDLGKLRQEKDTAKGIEWKGQKNYDMIGELLYQHIKQEMVETYKLKKVMIPDNKSLMEALYTDNEDDVKDKPRSDIYMSADFLANHQGDKNEKALVLIQGTGAVRAG